MSVLQSIPQWEIPPVEWVQRWVAKNRPQRDHWEGWGLGRPHPGILRGMQYDRKGVVAEFRYPDTEVFKLRWTWAALDAGKSGSPVNREES